MNNDTSSLARIQELEGLIALILDLLKLDRKSCMGFQITRKVLTSGDLRRSEECVKSNFSKWSKIVIIIIITIYF